MADSHLDRRFRADRPDQVWVADISELATRQGPLYLAVVVELYARRVVSHATAAHMHTELPLEALRMAVGQRRPPQGLLHH